MGGLEQFGVRVNVHTRDQAAALEEGFRLPAGSLLANEVVDVGRAATFVDGEGVSPVDRQPEVALGLREDEFLPD